MNAFCLNLLISFHLPSGDPVAFLRSMACSVPIFKIYYTRENSLLLHAVNLVLLWVLSDAECL
jgi:hypothetical protein